MIQDNYRRQPPTDDDVLSELVSINKRLSALANDERKRRSEQVTIPEGRGALAIIATAVVVAALSIVAACGAWQSPPAVSVAGSASDAVTKSLIGVEEAQAFSVIDSGGNPEALLQRWEYFWDGWRTWLASQRSWADAYEVHASGLVQAEVAAKGAFCEAKRRLPPEVPVVVLVGVGIACEALPALDAGVTDGGR